MENPDDRITCKPCRARNGTKCTAKTGFWAGLEIPPEARPWRIRCEGYLPPEGEEDQRPGAERWNWSVWIAPNGDGGAAQDAGSLNATSREKRRKPR